MYIEEIKTKDNRLAIRFVFGDTEDYNLVVEKLKEWSKYFLSVKKIEQSVYILDLFQTCYEPKDSLCDNKPTVTVFENHFFNIARIFADLVYVLMLNENNSLNFKKQIYSYFVEITKQINIIKKHFNEITIANGTDKPESEN